MGKSMLINSLIAISCNFRRRVPTIGDMTERLGKKLLQISQIHEYGLVYSSRTDLGPTVPAIKPFWKLSRLRLHSRVGARIVQANIMVYDRELTSAET